MDTGTPHIPVWNIGLARAAWLQAFLGRRPNVALLPWGHGSDAAWLGWGAKPSANRAAIYARVGKRRAIQLEDGFLRSFAPGRGSPPMSLATDVVGIYYDATRPSALENLLNSDADVLAGKVEEVARAKELILQHRISKYNHAPDWTPSHDMDGINSASPKVLVVDQTAGDLSVRLGGADGETFQAMLAAARAENPGATIYVKTHPEVSSGSKRGYLTDVQDDERTVVLRQPINPASLVQQMGRVYVVTSTMGFEALLAGKPVTCFGRPWYAGWGATDDRLPCPRRIRRRNVDELFAAAYFHYTRYLDPATLKHGTIFDAIDWLVRQKDMAARQVGPSGPRRLICVGLRRWKAAHLKPLLSPYQAQITFVDTVENAHELQPLPGDWVVFWGALPPAGLLELAEQSSAHAVRVEDGFVRSVGLGSDLIPPMSLVLDRKGIYFDPSRPSELEDCLNAGDFSAEELTRARWIREFMVEHGITKYNVEPRAIASWGKRTDGRRVLLVLGQVEDDASIRLGAGAVRTNLRLLKAARAEHPGAFIVYKPHPDVLSGNRKGKIALAQAAQYADHIESNLSAVSCLDACDEVHTITSLTGFEGLLRGKRVITYGQPFYAGWGLTDDRYPDKIASGRRNRRLTLDELVAGVMIRYPLYWDWDLRGYTTCEAVLQRLLKLRTELDGNGHLQRLHVGFWRRQLRKAATLVRAWASVRM